MDNLPTRCEEGPTGCRTGYRPLLTRAFVGDVKTSSLSSPFSTRVRPTSVGLTAYLRSAFRNPDSVDSNGVGRFARNPDQATVTRFLCSATPLRAHVNHRFARDKVLSINSLPAVTVSPRSLRFTGRGLTATRRRRSRVGCAREPVSEPKAAARVVFLDCRRRPPRLWTPVRMPHLSTSFGASLRFSSRRFYRVAKRARLSLPSRISSPLHPAPARHPKSLQFPME